VAYTSADLTRVENAIAEILTRVANADGVQDYTAEGRRARAYDLESLDALRRQRTAILLEINASTTRVTRAGFRYVP